MTTSPDFLVTPGYLVNLKTSLVRSLRSGFSQSCPWPNLRNLYVDIEYPQEKIKYPGIWVDFEPVGNLTRSGIDQPYVAYSGSDGRPLALSRWRAQGYATFTIGALSSTERDLLYDVLISMIAFSYQPPFNSFRYQLEVVNPLIDVALNADTISNRGSSERPTTEWGGDEIVYETTVAVELAVEFSAPSPGAAFNTLTAIDLAISVPDGSSEVVTDVVVPPVES